MKQKGFTLLELLTVIAIISLLANTAIAAAYTTRVKARDAVRIAEFDQFRKGLEQFYDTYGMYPCGDAVASGLLDMSTSAPFLNGAKRVDNDYSVPNKSNDPNDYSIGVDSACTIPPYYGLFAEEILTDSQPTDPAQDGYYLYRILDEARQTYELRVILENNDELMTNDGGNTIYFYEVGPGKNIL